MQNSPAVQTLHRVQLWRRFALLLAAALVVGIFAVVGSFPRRVIAHEAIENIGRFAIALCILGRSWSTLYIGGRKGRSLVDHGPYSVSRNPLYVFSMIGAAGFGLQSGSVTVGLASLILVLAVLQPTVRREEAFLLETLGADYRAYRDRTPRYIPDFSLWRAPESLEIKPRLVVVTFLDGLLFLIAIPLAEGLEHLQNAGWLPVLINLP